MEEPVVNPINFRDSEAQIGQNEICIEPAAHHLLAQLQGDPGNGLGV